MGIQFIISLEVLPFRTNFRRPVTTVFPEMVKRVLLLGAGMVSDPVANYYSMKQKDIRLTVGKIAPFQFYKFIHKFISKLIPLYYCRYLCLGTSQMLKKLVLSVSKSELNKILPKCNFIFSGTFISLR